MSLIEWVAVAFGLACVFLTIRQNVLCWPTGLVQVALYIYVFAEARLYSDVALHVIYVGLGVYGWWRWTRGGTADGRLAISTSSSRGILLWTFADVAGTIFIGAAMGRFTNADRPLWDAAVLVFSLIAQWLMARKVLESWLFWIAVDVTAIGLYAVKGLYPTTALYAVFLVLAIAGFFEWKRSMARAAATAAARLEPDARRQLQPA
jgi:nicotinamide mononucleotide transporter